MPTLGAAPVSWPARRAPGTRRELRTSRGVTSNSPSGERKASASVLIVDDEAGFRDALHGLVDSIEEAVLVAEAESGEQAVELVEELLPDLVVMDVRMPGAGGISAARSIKHAHPAVFVALVSASRPEELGREAEASLADAILWKGDLCPQVLAGLLQARRAA